MLCGRKGGLGMKSSLHEAKFNVSSNWRWGCGLTQDILTAPNAHITGLHSSQNSSKMSSIFMHVMNEANAGRLRVASDT